MKPKVLIVFYSRNGTVERLARAIAAGAEEEGAELRMRRAREHVGEAVMKLVPGWTENAARMNAEFAAPTVEDAEWCDAMILGAPTRFGAAASELRAYLEMLGRLWLTRTLFNKVGSAFTATSVPHGGLETTILSLYPTMAHLGFVIVPTGYGDEVLFRAGTPYGAGAISYAARQMPPTEDDITVARFQGRRVAAVTRTLLPLRQG
jgi:NAD(P)H dehydrogenase (quinone)